MKKSELKQLITETFVDIHINNDIDKLRQSLFTINNELVKLSKVEGLSSSNMSKLKEAKRCIDGARFELSQFKV